jgi:porphobilinogen synthase
MRLTSPRAEAAATAARWSQLRLRRTAHLRDLCAETSFTTAHLVQPLFVVEGLGNPEPIAGLDGNARLTVDGVLDVIADDVSAGVRHFLLFAVPRPGSPHGAFTAAAVDVIKRAFGDAVHLWVDICLCSSTDDGHCAIADRTGRIDLDATLQALEHVTLRAADAGADGVSPSDMMDGRTARLRQALDARGHGAIPIMSYSTKFASKFYGPFRSAAASAPKHGTREHYQIDVRNRTDAIRSSVRCAEEGADLLMVKPGMTSLDLIGPIRDVTGRPVGAYQVSGEYAGLCALGRDGLADFDAALRETWHVFRRAGAAYVITYGARLARSLGVPA